MESIEILKDIRGYENMYQISNTGRVYSLKANKFLNKSVHKCGYVKVSLIKDKRVKTYLVHRLVASNFIDNPNNYTVINHKDGNKQNNCVDNLEWCAVSTNTKHAFNNNLGGFRDKSFSELDKINKLTSYKKVIFKKGNEIIEFDSISKASDALGLKRDNITRAIRKKQKVGGYEVFGYKIANEETLLSVKAISWENCIDECNKPVETIRKE